MTVDNLTFDTAQVTFRTTPNPATATDYLDVALTCWDDGMIADTAMVFVLEELAHWYEMNDDAFPLTMADMLTDIRSMVEGTPNAMDDPVWIAAQRLDTVGRGAP